MTGHAMKIRAREPIKSDASASKPNKRTKTKRAPSHQGKPDTISVTIATFEDGESPKTVGPSRTTATRRSPSTIAPTMDGRRTATRMLRVTVD
jgi:hypothetical protein